MASNSANVHPSLNPVKPSLEEFRMHNASLPISRLNYDILIDIFMLNTVTDMKNRHLPSQTTRRSSQVCHLWRSIMLNYPMLWAASVDFEDHTPWMKQVVARSGSVPFPDIVVPSLSVYFLNHGLPRLRKSIIVREDNVLDVIPDLLYLFGDNVSEEMVAWVTPYLYQCRRFFIKISKRHWKHILENILQPLPILHTFSIVIKGSQQTQDSFELPEDLFSNHAPLLRVLDLRGCACHFSSPIFHTLTSLAIRKPSSPHLPTGRGWLEILGNMKDLRKLILICAFTPRDDDSATASMVSLPHLKTLVLEGDNSSCSEVFTHLDFNFDSLEMINVQCNKIRLDDHFTSTISCIHHHLNSSRITRDGLTVQCTPTGLKFDQKGICSQTSDRTYLSFSWFGSFSDRNIMAIFPSFMSVITRSCSEVTLLQLDFVHSAALQDSHIVEILSISPKVEELFIMMDYTLHRLLPILSLNPQDNPNHTSLFPLLRTVILEYVRLGEGNFYNDISTEFVAFVRKRSLMGSQIKEIVFIKCEVAKIITVELEELGVHVTNL
ncbi:hypothetical protein BDN70DRAFT_882367 [Pholiota conissans]|uniref:F-box domain-containing protein n=1 Tax=Pholiota conissans TaxID=109636 RepID=A0A9P6CXN4_9AGAR|nr:hypothetical protein BDN70DRAFT_882367 [Pholiota conissans]